MNCKDCGTEIPKERIELGYSDYCVKCSDNHNAGVVGFMDFAHKTGGEIVIVKRDDAEALRLADRANKRAR